MIARVWSARTTQTNLKPYLEHLSRNVLRELHAMDGFAGLTAITRELRESRNAEVEVIVTTYWRSRHAIRAFAGADDETAVVADEAARLLTTFDRRVKHFDLVLSDSLLSQH